MRKALCFILLCSTLVTISGCNKNNDTSLASILIYNHQVFVGTGQDYVPTGEHETLQMVGIISQQFSGDHIPNPYSIHELIANELTAGTEIYLLDETTLLAKTQDTHFKLFELFK
ncbi:hypothetical protein D3C77_561270 [compost metagenome]